MFGRASKPKPPRIETLIGSTVKVQGDIEFSGGLHIDGRVAGNVKAPLEAESTLSVSEQGCIEGAVQATHVVLNGVVKGDIRACGRVVLGAQARVQGNVSYGVIEMSLGAQIRGKLVQVPAAAVPVAAGASAS